MLESNPDLRYLMMRPTVPRISLAVLVSTFPVSHTMLRRLDLDTPYSGRVPKEAAGSTWVKLQIDNTCVEFHLGDPDATGSYKEYTIQPIQFVLLALDCFRYLCVPGFELV